MNNNMDERLRDLLCDRATFGLTDVEQKELDRLTESADSGMDAHTLELAAAAIFLAETKIEQMPSHLEAKLMKVAEEHFAAPAESFREQPTRTFKWEEAKPRRSIFDWAGWGLAAAMAALLIGVFVYDRQRIDSLQSQIAELQKPAPPEPTMAEKRDRLLRDANDLKRASWSPGNVAETKGVTGEVVWSDSLQEGYMTFRGLPVNDPNKEAYQLWMFEEAKLEDFPKDGGVFNVNREGEVVIRIDPKLRTVDPKAFAITIEKPGGVVRSSRERIAVLAPVKPSQV